MPLDSANAKLANQIASTGDPVDREFAAFLRRHPLPWEQGGLAIVPTPCLVYPPLPRKKFKRYERLTTEDVATLVRVAERYARMIAASEMPPALRPHRKRQRIKAAHADGTKRP